MAWIEIVHETCIEIDSETSLCLHYGHWHMENGEIHSGYRFMYRYNGRLQTYRGQTRLPSKSHADRLWEQAEQEGWADLNGR